MILPPRPNLHDFAVLAVSSLIGTLALVSLGGIVAIVVADDHSGPDLRPGLGVLLPALAYPAGVIVLCVISAVTLGPWMTRNREDRPCL